MYSPNMLVESNAVRNTVLSEVSDSKSLDTLNKAKALVMATWQGKNVAATEQVAEFYEVSVEATRQVVKRHHDEFDADGLKTVKGKALRDASDILSLPLSTSQANLWTPRAALRLGMLLRDSQVAQQVRTLLLNLVEAVAPQPTQPTLEKMTEKQVTDDIDYIHNKIALSHPRLAQHLIDNLVNRTFPALASASPEDGERWAGVVEIAEDLGYPVTPSNRSHLGKHVKALLGDHGKTERRLCNGTMRDIMLYRTTGPIVEVIKRFFEN